MAEQEFRYEIKYLIEGKTPDEIEREIKNNPGLFSEIYYKRKVNSLYLDTAELSNYKDHLAGIEQRLKIRIRWYGKIFGKIDPILEIKIKQGVVGRKKSFKLKEFKFRRGALWREFYKESILKSNLPKEILESLKLVRPVLLISYDRKYFISADKNYRITLDENLTYFKMNSLQNFFLEKLKHPLINILEIKYSVKNSNNSHKISNFLPFRITAISKYIDGIELLD